MLTVTYSVICLQVQLFKVPHRKTLSYLALQLRKENNYGTKIFLFDP